MQDISRSILITVEEATRQRSVSHAKAFQLIAQEGWPVMRFDKSMHVDPDTLRAWVKGRAKNQQQ